MPWKPVSSPITARVHNASCVVTMGSHQALLVKRHSETFLNHTPFLGLYAPFSFSHIL
ncbi:hypothetical protein PGT21_030413 [Puccinia graminis f. sp. tritici]|uniref:Uncharacterized protein n=1 Tax=Puccinia graminis f. sp. tritici TaxID=56615 RepID=A0A5B0PDU6_PUCGR|nr:hypothetical protein PGT21_030413 [Puccinia graminis f. sp. tritici]KAA1099233.1 hypothetical protein PGTUg99_023719 [Puccinia graminis f. sp. tritici]